MKKFNDRLPFCLQLFADETSGENESTGTENTQSNQTQSTEGQDNQEKDKSNKEVLLVIFRISMKNLLIIFESVQINTKLITHVGSEQRSLLFCLR